MPYLGAIATTFGTAQIARVTSPTPPGTSGPRAFPLAELARYEAHWAISIEFPLLLTNTTGRYSAVVKQYGVPLAGCRVILYWRDNNVVVARAHTASDGSFEFVGLIPGINRYYAVVLDPDGGVLQNALVYDRLTPVV